MNMGNVHIHTGTQNVHNVHNAHIYIYIYNIGIPKHKKLLRLSLFRYETFYYLWVKRFFDIRREIHVIFPSAPNHVSHLPPGLGEQAKVNSLLPRQNSTNRLFSNPPKSSAHASGAWRHSHPQVIFSIWDFYFDICERHILPARASTPALKFAPN